MKRTLQNLLRGGGSVLVLSPQYSYRGITNIYRVNPRDPCYYQKTATIDREAIQSDWKSVGMDITNVIEVYKPGKQEPTS